MNDLVEIRENLIVLTPAPLIYLLLFSVIKAWGLPWLVLRGSERRLLPVFLALSRLDNLIGLRSRLSDQRSDLIHVELLL